MKKKPIKTRNSGNWTEARYHSFIMSALRKAHYPVKYEALKLAYRHDGINTATGRKCKLYQCAACGQLFPQKEVAVDHITPIVPTTGFDSWDAVINRLYCELPNFQVLCKPCHSVKSKAENAERREHKKAHKTPAQDLFNPPI